MTGERDWPTGFRAVLADRGPRALLASHGLSGIGQTLGTVATSVALFEATHSTTWVSVGAAARLLPYMLFSALAGVVADRLDRRRLLLASHVARALLTAALLVVVGFDGSPWLVVLLSFVAGAAGTVCYPAMAATLPRQVEPRELPAANALLSTVETAAFVIGPAIGGAVLMFASPAVVIAANIVVFGLAVLVLVPVRFVQAGKEKSEGPPSVGQQVREAARVVGGSADALVPLLLVVVVNLVYGIATVLLLPVSESLLGIGEAGYGYLNAALGVGAFAALLVSGRLALRDDAMRILIGSVLLTAVPFAVLALRPASPLAAVLMAFAGAGSVITEVVALTLLQRAAPVEVMARIAGMFDGLVVSAVFVGSLVAPALALAGLPIALVVTGAIVPLVTVAAGRRLLRLGSLVPTVDDELVGQLAGFPMFHGVSRLVLQSVAASARVETVEAGTTVIQAGAEPDDFFVLRSGGAVVLSAGEEKPLAVVHPGDGFGEIGLLAGIPRTATVRTTEPSVLARIDGATFVQVVNASPLSAAAAPALGALARGTRQ